MKIPILNFLLQSGLKNKNIDHNLHLKKYENLNFHKVRNEIFPIYKLFNNLNKKRPQNFIKFNIGNEFAVNLFKNKLIRYTDIYKIIEKVISLNLYSDVNTIKDIIHYHEEIEKKLLEFKNNFN